MPVGCLGDASAASLGGSVADMDIIVTSSILNTAEQFAFMQQTLLMQIFRIPTTSTETNPDGRHSSNSSETTSSSSANSGRDYPCPTCVAFSDQCCQMDNGGELYQEFLELNLQCNWEAKIVEALGSLR